MAEESLLVGRQAETALIDALLQAAATGTSGALILFGEAGIGKTALLDYAAQQSSNLRLLRTEGVEPEADLPFAGLHRLLLPVLDSVEALPSSQAAAMRAALGLGSGSGDRFLVGAGVLSLLSDVAAASGVLCLVDNAQWLDPESADALAFAARRLEAEGTVMLLAARSTGGSTWPGIAARALTGLAGPDATRLLRHSAQGLAGAVLDRVVQTSAGNPQALLELPTAMTPDQRAGTEPLPAELPLGERIQAAMMRRVAELPEPTRQLLLLVATDPAADLAILTSAAAGVGMDVADLEPAERAGLVITTADGVRFGSPLLRSAVYADATFLRRRAVHAALADALHSSQPDRWAWHQAAIAQGPDPVLAGELERSAERARGRAGHAATAAALERAAELTSDGPHRARRLVAAATAAWEAGQTDRAERLATRAEELPLTTELRGRIGFVRGLIQTHRGRPADAVEQLGTVAAALAHEDPDLALQALIAAMEAAAIAGDFSHAPRLAGLAAGLAAGHTSPAGGLLTGLSLIVQGDPAAAALPLRSFIDHVHGSDDPRWLSWGAAAASFLGDEHAASQLYDRAISAARALGAISSLPWLLENRALLEAVSGRITLAEADAAESLQLADEVGGRPPLVAMASLTMCAAFRGQEQAAREIGERTVAEAERHAVGLPIGLVTATLLELDLALGKIDSALVRAREVVAQTRNMHPMVAIITAPARAEVMLRAGLPVTADETALYRSWVQGTPSQAHHAIALRCEAMLADPEAAGALFEGALDLHRGADRPYDQARTQLLYGEFLRRQRQPVKAREHLRGAAETFARLDAPLWAERARTELRAAGESTAPPSRDGFADLTPQELQIVRLVSGGLSNRQVAEHLFLSPRTVEYHLYKVYPKLGIGSRTELIRHWGEQLAGSATG
jgi:ATP/maltotriose-dependent transcriptional regulator MalT